MDSLRFQTTSPLAVPQKRQVNQTRSQITGIAKDTPQLKFAGGGGFYVGSLALNLPWQLIEDSFIKSSLKEILPPCFTEKSLDELFKVALDYPNAVNAKDGKTVLMLAIQAERPEDAIAVIEKGADVNAKDMSGNTALHHVAESKTDKMVPVAKQLLEQGADINAQNSEWRAPLHNVETDKMLKLFLHKKYKANVNIKTHLGITPLHVKVDRDKLKQAELLLQAKASPNVINEGYCNPPLDGLRPPLTLANTDEMVNLLLEYGADASLLREADKRSMERKNPDAYAALPKLPKLNKRLRAGFSAFIEAFNQRK